ncbi:hypothetical protein LOK49_LG08G00518 [Camellia lanceoleosa]|uniref:Uncharacterized protein n=1 Tax=Camellia lanceoleosa TaxID=1840588 RepID=A0ACC0GSP4_9ERIC|nr:hypothetical protein LOK49_LG08G00518 [Camellia lanceoleosa]
MRTIPSAWQRNVRKVKFFNSAQHHLLDTKFSLSTKGMLDVTGIDEPTEIWHNQLEVGCLDKLAKPLLQSVKAILTNYSQYSVPPFNSSINGHKRKQPTEGTQYENFIQPKKVTDRDDQWSDNRTESNLCITNQSKGLTEKDFATVVMDLMSINGGIIVIRGDLQVGGIVRFGSAFHEEIKEGKRLSKGQYESK